VDLCKECVKNQKVNVPSVLLSLIHSVSVWLKRGLQPLSERVLQPELSTVCPFNVQHPLVSLSSSCNCLRMIRLPVPSNLLSLRYAILCFTIQLLSAMFLIMLFFLLSVLYPLLLSSLTLCNISSFPTQLNTLNFYLASSTTLKSFPVFFNMSQEK
jgi:hypothetical protein